MIVTNTTFICWCFCDDWRFTHKSYFEFNYCLLFLTVQHRTKQVFIVYFPYFLSFFVLLSFFSSISCRIHIQINITLSVLIYKVSNISLRAVTSTAKGREIFSDDLPIMSSFSTLCVKPFNCCTRIHRSANKVRVMKGDRCIIRAFLSLRSSWNSISLYDICSYFYVNLRYESSIYKNQSYGCTEWQVASLQAILRYLGTKPQLLGAHVPSLNSYFSH